MSRNNIKCKYTSSQNNSHGVGCIVSNCSLTLALLYRLRRVQKQDIHYYDVIMGTIGTQITSLTTVYSTVYSDGDQRKHQRSTSLAFVRGIHRGPPNVSIWWRHHVKDNFIYSSLIDITNFATVNLSRCIPKDIIGDKSTLDQVLMAWGGHAKSVFWTNAQI